MNQLSSLEAEVGELIIESLNLEDITLEDIEPEAALFNEGLGLDSIDALELAMVLSEKYGVKLSSDDPDNERIFSSLRALSAHVETNSKI